jgi:predicted RNA-binding protein with PIN domain
VITISSIIIDGYNCIGIQHKDLKAQREHFINVLGKYKTIKGNDITVVFDGWKSGSHREETLHTSGIKVIYSRLGESADHVIKRIIGTENKEWRVITSDRDIISYAWSIGSVPVSSAKFCYFLEFNFFRSFHGIHFIFLIFNL